MGLLSCAGGHQVFSSAQLLVRSRAQQQREGSFFLRRSCMLWQGWPSGESTFLPPMWPEFDFLARCHMQIEFVGSLLCYKRFFPGYSGFPPGTPVFPSHQKPTFDL